MRVMRILIALLLALLASVAHAQTAGVITFTVEATTGAAGTVVPKVTWATTPAATSCTGSSGWSGSKAASGTETLAAITKSANYKIDCSWADSKATLTWVAPTKNTDGSSLTDLAGFRAYYGTSTATMSKTQTASAGATSMIINALTPGTWYFSLSAFTAAGVEGELAPLPPASKVIGAATSTKSVALGVNIPMAPTSVEAQ